MERRRRHLGFLHAQVRRKKKEKVKFKKSRFGTLIFVSMELICMKISHLKYGIHV